MLQKLLRVRRMCFSTRCTKFLNDVGLWLCSCICIADPVFKVLPADTHDGYDAKRVLETHPKDQEEQTADYSRATVLAETYVLITFTAYHKPETITCCQ